MTTNQTERASLLESLHIKGEPLILFNVWDAVAPGYTRIGQKRLPQAVGQWRRPRAMPMGRRSPLTWCSGKSQTDRCEC